MKPLDYQPRGRPQRRPLPSLSAEAVGAMVTSVISCLASAGIWWLMLTINGWGRVPLLWAGQILVAAQLLVAAICCFWIRPREGAGRAVVGWILAAIPPVATAAAVIWGFETATGG